MNTEQKLNCRHHQSRKFLVMFERRPGSVSWGFQNFVVAEEESGTAALLFVLSGYATPPKQQQQ